MTEQDQILIDDFKARLRLLIHRHDRLKTEKQQLLDQLELLRNEIAALKAENRELLIKYDNLKIARVLSVSDQDKQQAKQRINKIVREIDKCIAQLNV
jgi:regulator of replication initiation timing